MHHCIHKFSTETENVIHNSPSKTKCFIEKLSRQNEKFPYYMHNFPAAIGNLFKKNLSPKREVFIHSHTSFHTHFSCRNRKFHPKESHPYEMGSFQKNPNIHSYSHNFPSEIGISSYTILSIINMLIYKHA